MRYGRSLVVENDAAPITYVQSDAASLPLGDDAFDVALCQQGLQFFPDRSRALAELRRTLKPGARLAVSTWKDIEHSPYIAIVDALAHHLGREAGEMMSSPFALSDEVELATVVSAAGFDEVVVTEEKMDCTWSSHTEFARLAIAASPVAPVFSRGPEEARRAVADEVATRLRPYATRDGRLRMPMATNVAIARA
jgi:SAM-dependent methyltransferase